MSVEELGAFGLSWMDEGEISMFLSSQGMGILGLADEEAPYLVPLSFGYDGDSTLYFTYVLGESSRKEQRTEGTDTASFLVYNAASMFQWQSVLLYGTLEVVPDDDRDAAEAALENAWDPAIFRSAELSRGVELYRFRIEERTGVKHTGLPPGFER